MILDGFAGPGGWSEGIRLLGLRDIGLELDWHACKTRAAAGHLTIQCDIAQYPTAPFKGRVKRQVGSPPCQAWTRAGKQLGLIDQPLVHQAVHDLAHGRDTRDRLKSACKDERSILAAEPMRWIADLRPEWVCLEEVPAVLTLWKQYAEYLRGWGYSIWTGILNAADYGVPQSRKRAILIASRLRPATAPDPTHAEQPAPDLFGHQPQEWVSMADALGWASGRVVNTRGHRTTPGGNEFSADGPSWALTEKTRSWSLRNNTQKNAARRSMNQPAATLFFGARCNDVSWVCDETGEAVRITEAEAAVLQSFRADYPWQGSKTRRFLQIGNAVPPLLAAHIVSAATGIPMPAATAAAA